MQQESVYHTYVTFSIEEQADGWNAFGESSIDSNSTIIVIPAAKQVLREDEQLTHIKEKEILADCQKILYNMAIPEEEMMTEATE